MKRFKRLRLTAKTMRLLRGLTCVVFGSERERERDFRNMC
ncbi:Uncharacterised protein [Vibrio cholerae]|nr:Uncharacterised protein [Vibrio cholerae]